MALVPTNMFGRRVTTQPTLPISPPSEESNVRCVRNKYNLDVTKDGVLEVLLRTHVDLICNGKPGEIRANSVHIFINDVLQKLGLTMAEVVRKFGIHTNINTAYTDDTNTYAAISYLRQVIGRIAEEKRIAENKAKLLLNKEAKQRANQAIKQGERRAKNEANWKAKYERNILGLSSASAAAEPEVKLLNMNAIRKAQIAKNLEGLFGGVRRTGKHKYRKSSKSSKSRRSHKSRKHSRK